MTSPKAHALSRFLVMNEKHSKRSLCIPKQAAEIAQEILLLFSTQLQWLSLSTTTIAPQRCEAQIAHRHPKLLVPLQILGEKSPGIPLAGPYAETEGTPIHV